YENVPCLDVSHEKLVLELSNTKATSSYRPWFYQTCTEFGFYQTCEDTSCPFSRMLTIQSQTELCSRLFEIPQHCLPVHTNFTNMYYGGLRPQTQRVLYVNRKHVGFFKINLLLTGLTIIGNQGGFYCGCINEQ
uniref:Uncharacterized protein n=1 Tax=Cyprinus carpio TaxID=7962 RepID=A0A8C1RWU2_CYPCA